MSLTSSLQIGRSALTASQLAIQVTGNNLANAATPGFTRQVTSFSPIRGTDPNTSAGRGVEVRGIRRQFDSALQSRVWAGLSHEAAAQQQHQILTSLESSLGELGTADLSSELGRFFNAWSERANLVQSSAVVVQQGENLAGFVRRVRDDLVQQRNLIDRQAGGNVARADELLAGVAELNSAIADAEAGGATANALRDQRDALISEVSGIMGVTAVEQPSGAVNVLVGSTPVVLGSVSRGLELRRETVDGELEISVRVRDDGEELGVSSGALGALLGSRGGVVNGTLEQLDGIASQLIFQINRLHSTGTNAAGLTTTTGTLAVAGADRSLALNDPNNATLAGLPFSAVNGGFTVNVRQTSTGAMQSVRIDIDLDGLTSAGAPGVGDDTSLEDIRSSLDAIPGVTATVTPEGKLKLDAGEGFDFSFSDDSSGALAVLGMNAYFSGTDASDIGVRAELADGPSLLMTGRLVNGQFVENGTALRMVEVQDQSLAELGGLSVRGSWLGVAQNVGSETDAAKTRAGAATLVRQSLDSQRAAISGVSVDEEAINLMTFQRQYQGAARFLSVVDELTQTLISLV